MSDHKTLNQNTAGRLLAYSAAAGLGAFAFGPAAEASIIYTPVDPAVGVGESASFDFDFNHDGTADAAVINATHNIQMRPFNGSVTLTSEGTYYAKAFDPGVTLDSTTNKDTDHNDPPPNNTGYQIAATPGFNDVGAGKYIGFQLAFADGTHYGWARVDVDSINPLHAIVYGYAYESTPDTAIVTGEMPVPEPTSLALLAAGAGALAVRRRRTA